MADWIAGGAFILGCLWAVPAWHYGKAAGMRHALAEMGRLHDRREFKKEMERIRRENGGW